MVVFKPRKFSITIDDPDEAENFLRGLIVARSNNSSPYFVDLIDAVNAIMESHRGEIMKETMAAREAAGM
jgi:nitrate reductase alpha subunit